ncbi:MAG TPA: hypothetical protein PLU22_16445, partial [Polyangiaceae bacterium]|nr:hypothetical protein [Polyangiaceae bacterium]
YNHFALQAEAWLAGRLDLGGPPPPHAGGNDFAFHDGRWYVVFPPFPALLLLPLVALAGGAERVPDGLAFLALAGVGPAALFLSLERLRRTGRGVGAAGTSLALSLLFAFGTVYFFTAVQGTVWYAAHVVGVGLAALYLLCSLEAAHPWLAGLALGLGFLTRAPLLLAFPLFVAEALRVSGGGARHLAGAGPPWRRWVREVLPRSLRRLGPFLVPVTAAVAVTLVHDAARFGDPFDPGYRHLVIAWRGRIEQWGLLHYHYLGRNLAVILASVPWIPAPGSGAPLQISGHGLALWVTSPFLLWATCRGMRHDLGRALGLTALLVALPSLLYQNTGWVQFGYRFSNDYSVFLFALLAAGGAVERRGFWAAGALAVLVNAFGALTFDRPAWARYYHVERTQAVIFQPD